jgi:hypothetical protein
LVVLLHQIVLFVDSLRDWFKLGHFCLDLISFMLQLLVLLFDMVN